MIEFIDVLRKKGYKVTPQRIELFKIIKASKHPTVDEVYQKVKTTYPTVSPATVYKTIELLKGIGEVQEIGVVDGKILYETNTTPHINLHCINCNRIEDIGSDLTEKLVKDIQNKTKSKIVGLSINFYVYCSECQNKMK